MRMLPVLLAALLWLQIPLRPLASLTPPRLITRVAGRHLFSSEGEREFECSAFRVPFRVPRHVPSVTLLVLCVL